MDRSLASKKIYFLLQKTLVVDPSQKMGWKELFNIRTHLDNPKALDHLKFTKEGKPKKFLKYHLFEKRDGGIINCVKRENGEIESESEKVNELLATTMKEIQINSRWEFLEEKEFPKLNRLNEKEMDLKLTS